MALVYFQIIKEDGTEEPHLMPSEQISLIRPLTEREATYARELGEGLYEKFLENGHAAFSHFSRDMTENERKALANYKVAHIGGANSIVPHVATKSVLVATDETRYFLAQTVNELALMHPDLIALTEPPKAPPHHRPLATPAQT